MTHDDDVEPEVTLRSGATVNAGIYQTVAFLQAAGHRVWVCDSRVLITPPAPIDTWTMLDSCWHDVEKVLSDVGPATVH